MVEISIADGVATFEVRGIDKVWSFKSQIHVPLVHITGAIVDPEVARGWWHGIRMPGTQVPGVITAGTFYQHGRRVFYDVHEPDKTIVIALNHEKFDQLVVEVADPQAEVGRITLAIRPQRN